MNFADTKFFRYIACPLLFVATLPVNVSLLNVPGPTSFIPVVYGLPTEKGLEEAKQGKYYLGGCILGDLKSMFVW
jgi:hypothetical protein